MVVTLVGCNKPSAEASTRAPAGASTRASTGAFAGFLLESIVPWAN